METPNSEKNQTARYIYWLLAIAAFVVIVAGISGAFVPEEQDVYTETTESTVKPATNRGNEVNPTE
jgi:hypothetical protein